MILEIEDNKTISEFQQEFDIHYPYLKIEFFKRPHGYDETSPEEDRFPHHSTLGEIRGRHNPGALEVFSWTRTGDIEQQLSKRFGLFAQIYRLEGKEWVQTAGTDELTLKEQNEIGHKAAGGTRFDPRNLLD